MPSNNDDYITGMVARMAGRGMPHNIIDRFIREAIERPDEYPTITHVGDFYPPDQDGFAAQMARTSEGGILYWQWADGQGGFPPPTGRTGAD